MPKFVFALQVKQFGHGKNILSY
jgi:hypothetical protein